MLVFDTIKVKQAAAPVVLCSTRSIRTIAAIGALSSYGFLMLALNSDAPSRYLIAFGMYAFIFIGLWFWFFRKIVVADKNNGELRIFYTLFGATFKQAHIPLVEITRVYSENRSHGQTIQKKLRLFAASESRELDLGVVNHEKKSDEILKLLRAEIGLPETAEKSEEDATPSEE